MTKKGLE